MDISFKAVEQPFDLGTPEGKLLFHLVSSLGEFYSDNLSKETNKGKLERSTQGYHNGAVPWGYISQLQGNRKVGVLDPEKAHHLTVALLGVTLSIPGGKWLFKKLYHFCIIKSY